MAASIDATVGAATSNSYLTVIEAETYFDTRLSASDWSDAAAQDKIIALIMATRVMDKMWDWVSIRTDTTQVLDWPRIGVLSENKRETILNNVIPTAIKNATAEFAMQLLTEDRTLDSDIEKLRIRSLKAGAVMLTFAGGVTATVVPDAVFYLIPKWWGNLRARKQRSVQLSRA